MIKSIFYALISLVTVFSINHHSALAMFETDESKTTNVTVLQMKKLAAIKTERFLVEEKVPLAENCTIIINRKFYIMYGSSREKTCIALKKLADDSVIKFKYTSLGCEPHWKSEYQKEIGSIEIHELGQNDE